MAEIRPFKRGELKRPIGAEDEGINKLVNDFQRYMGWSDEKLQNAIVEGADFASMFAGGGLAFKGAKGAVKVTAKGANIAGQKILKEEGIIRFTTHELWTIARTTSAKYGKTSKFYFNKLRTDLANADIAKTLNDPKLIAFEVGQLKKRTLQKIFSGGAITRGVGIGLTALSADMIVTWMLSDNIPFIANSLATKIEWKVRNGDLKSAEDYKAAYKTMEIAADALAMSRNKMETMWNPFTKPWQPEYKANIEGAEEMLRLSKEILDEGAKEFIKEMIDPKERDLEFRGVTYETEEERLTQEKSFMASQEKMEQEQLQKERELKGEEREAQSAERAKMRSQVGIGALSRPPVEQKKRREPTKLKFGL